MAIERVTDNVILISRFTVVNCYLVLEDEGATAIDTGIPGMDVLLLRAAEVAGRRITRVLLTHAHFDHVGALDTLAEKLPDAQFLFTPRTARLLSGDLSLEPEEPQKPLEGGFSPRKTRPTRTIVPGERVGSLRVIACPGHSPDHVAFLDERDGTLMCGDAFQTKGGVAVAGVVRIGFPFPAMGTWDAATAARSARQLVNLKPRRLAPGHGRVLETPVAAMERAVTEAEAKITG